MEHIRLRGAEKVARDVHGGQPRQLGLLFGERRAGFFLHTQKREHIGVRAQRQVVALRRFHGALRRNAAVEQGAEQRGPQKGKAVVEVPAQRDEVAALRHFFIQLFARVGQRADEFGRGDGLEQIAQAVERHGLPREFKIVVSAEDDKPRRGQRLARLFQHRQPVHQRHADIGNDQVGLFFFAELQGFQPVGGLPDYGETVFFEVHHFHQTFADVALVVCQQELIHGRILRKQNTSSYGIVQSGREIYNCFREYA